MFRRRFRSVFLACREANVGRVIDAVVRLAVGGLRRREHARSGEIVVLPIIEVPRDIAGAAVLLRAAAARDAAAHGGHAVLRVVPLEDVGAVAAVHPLLVGDLGPAEITSQEWMNSGYCTDVFERYYTQNGMTAMCGSVASCCGTQKNCGSGNVAWHFYDGQNNYFTGPSMFSTPQTANCKAYNSVDNSAYVRLSACKKY